MSGKDLSVLDRRMALLIVKPSSGRALDLAREARMVRTRARDDEELQDLCSSLYGDSLALHGSALNLESDPEIVRRNLLARLISGVFPALNSVEEFRSFEDKGPWELFLGSLGIVSEIATATQYLEASRLSAASHFERELVKVEDRMLSMVEGPSGPEDEKKIEEVYSFTDRLRALEMGPRERPFVPFLLWMLIVVLSYIKVKEHL